MIVVMAIREMFAYVKLMTEDMRGDVPAELVDATAAWAAHIYQRGNQILADLKQIDEGIRPWVNEVMAQGHTNVARPSWLEGR